MSVDYHKEQRIRFKMFVGKKSEDNIEELPIIQNIDRSGYVENIALLDHGFFTNMAPVFLDEDTHVPENVIIGESYGKLSPEQMLDFTNKTGLCLKYLDTEEGFWNKNTCPLAIWGGENTNAHGLSYLLNAVGKYVSVVDFLRMFPEKHKDRLAYELFSAKEQYGRFTVARSCC